VVSKRSKIITTILLYICFFSIIFYFAYTFKKTTNQQKDTPTEQLQTNIESIDISQMTLEEKVGQLFIFGFWGTEPDYYITKMIQERYIGGVILLGYNIGNPQELKSLTTDLQELSKTPLFISIDQEGGVVSRIKPPMVKEIIPQTDITSYEQGYTIAKNRGEELKGYGINMNFAPVVDVINSKDSFLYNRVFRNNTLELSEAMIKGYEDSGVIPVVKHFPGHSNDSEDPHDTLSKVNSSREDIESNLSIFKSLFQETNTSAVMIGHILFPKISEDPASLSKVFVTDILRNELGFKGISITDDIQMKALTKNYDIKKSTLMAILAGNDVLLFTGIPEEQAEAYDTVLNAVKNGDISESLIDEKVRRIMEVKETIFLQ
jgi:beta-N-acetylhexosaminidase